MRSGFWGILLLLVSPYALLAQENTIRSSEPFTIEASYVGDFVNHLGEGGLRKGSVYLGLASIGIQLETENAGLWKGGRLLINAANTHGATPSADLLGDIQVVSNIEAGHHTFIHELLFQQRLRHIELTVGLQDLNNEFANSENAAVFINSSFGILPLISGNTTAPIFPLTALGFTFKWMISDQVVWLNAIYDGNPTDFDYNPYNLKWQFNAGDGVLIISEFQFQKQLRHQQGTYKLGFYSHNHLIEESLDSPIPDSLDRQPYGFYAYADQQLWDDGNRRLAAFLQLGYSPSAEVTNNFYLGLGLNFRGAFTEDGRDVLGLAMANAHFSNDLKCETALELSYQYQLTSTLFLQPDLQYVIQPAGTGETLSNAFAMLLRFGFEL